MALVHPIIVIPGITATHLRDEYATSPETVWSVLKKDYDRVSLHPDNLLFEAREPAVVRPDSIFEIAYKELIEELRHNLREKEDKPVPVFPFAYDWRQPLDRIERELEAFIEEVVARTLLLRHYHQAGYADDPRVNLVGHSMGGLIIAGYLQRKGEASRVAKVATLATPFGGSFEAPLKIATGTADLGSGDSSSRERESARVTPALYHLLPSFPGLDENYFSPQLWQPGILKTLEEFVRLHGVKSTNAKAQATDLLSSLLSTAEAHHVRVTNLSLPACGLEESDWLCVVGADATTRIRLKVEGTPAAPNFRLRSIDRDNLWDKGETAEERMLTGDGTVPFAGALPPFLDRASVVCVTPDDFGYWELADRAATGIAGFHGILPNMDMLHRLLVRHFTGRPDKHDNTWGRRVPGVDAWKPPLRLEEKGKKQ